MSEMIKSKQSLGVEGVTYFTLQKDEKGWKAVVSRNNRVLKESYGINGTKKEAKTIRGTLVNRFWSYKLN